MFLINSLLVVAIASFLVFVVTLVAHLKYRERVLQRQRDQTEFMAVMIHELRSPLSVIKSSADMMLKDAGSLSADQISEMLAQTRESASSLLGIVNNLLDITKIEAGKVELHKSNVDINSIIIKEVERFRSLAAKKGLEFKVDLDPTIKVVNCDAEIMIHILNNLLSNAIKFTDEGSVAIISKGYKKYVQVTVADTGRGIKDDMKKKLFHKYAQIENGAVENNLEDKGTGLGLVIVKGMIEAHGGRIWVDDNEPGGSKFNFTLPLM